MKDKKLLKIIAIIGCAVTALTAVVLAACNPDNGGGEEQPHQHAYSDSWSFDLEKHWHAATCGHEDEFADADKHDLNSAGKCSVCGAVIVNYEFFAQDYEAKTYSGDLVSGIFTVCSGTTIRTRTKEGVYIEEEKVSDAEYTKSVQLNDASSKVKISIPTEGVLVLHVQNGSGGTVPRQRLTLKKPDGATETVEYSGSDSSNKTQLVKLELTEKGEYEITRPSGTSDIYYMSFTAVVEDTPIEKIEVAATGKVSYFVGQDFSTEGLAVNAVHKDTGRISPVALSALEVDYSAYDKTRSGAYTIKVSYTADGKTFNASYTVKVFAIGSLTLGTDKTVRGNNTSAGNSVYENRSLRQLYFTGETLSDDGLSVILNSSEGGQKVLLNSNQYTLSAVDTSTVGKKTVTVSYGANGSTVTATFGIFVIAKNASLATATSVDIAVNAATPDAAVGLKNGAGAYQVKTIHQALDFLNNAGVKADAKKTVNLAAGTYFEKLEVTVPNLTIVGADKNTTTIEYDSLYGIEDASGYAQVTDSCATLNVREGAVNFTIKGVTVSNWYNSLARFDEKFGPNYPEHRALAMLVQADKFTMYDCKLLGYQDTVELFKGRQYIVNTYISGTTDFIFGTNNTTYFYNCEIHSISNGKTDGGYITAFKGCNKGSSDYVTYGAIFDGCRFTADSDVLANKNTAIGRVWDAYAAVAVINSQIDAHVSTQGFNNSNKNQRYVSMNAKPTDPTVKFVEYNNTGAGSISNVVAGMRFLSAEEATGYSTFSVIFGTTNGNVTYSSVWIPNPVGGEE